MNIDEHIAVSLYQYNVSPDERARKIMFHFNGACAPLDELFRLVDHKNWATEMALPTAKIYLQHAIDRYGAEATERRRVNEMPLYRD